MARLNSGTREVQLNGIAEPSANTDAATKGYVDGEFARSTGQTTIDNADLVTFLDASNSNAPSRITFENMKSELEVQDALPTAYAPAVNVLTGVWTAGSNRNATTMDRVATHTTYGTFTDNDWARMQVISNTIVPYAVTTPIRWDLFASSSTTRLIWDFGANSANNDAVTAMNDSTDDFRYIGAWADNNNWCVWKLEGTSTFFEAIAGGNQIATVSTIDLEPYIIAAAGEAQNEMAWTLYHTNNASHTSWPFRVPGDSDYLRLANGDNDRVYWQKHHLDIDLQVVDTATSIANEDLVPFVDESDAGNPTKKITLQNLRTELTGTLQDSISIPYVPNYTTDWPTPVSDTENTGARAVARTDGTSSTDDGVPIVNPGWCMFSTGDSSPYPVTQYSISGTIAWQSVGLDDDLRLGLDFGGTSTQAANTITAMNDDTDNFRFLAAYIDDDNWAVWHFTGSDTYFNTDNEAIGTHRTTAWNDQLLAHAGDGFTATSEVSWAVFHSGTSALSTGTPLRAPTSSDYLILDPRNNDINEWRKFLVGAAQIQTTDTPSNDQVLTWNTGGTLTWEDSAASSVSVPSTGTPTNILERVSIDSVLYAPLEVNQTSTQVRLDGDEATPLTGFQIDDFNATRAGVVNAANGSIRPNWLTLQLTTTIKTDVLAYQGADPVNDGGRRWQALQGANAGDTSLTIVSTRPATWEALAGPTHMTIADDTIRIDDAGGTFTSAVITAMQASTTDQTFVCVTDQFNWCIYTFNAGDGGCFFSDNAGTGAITSIQNNRTATGLVRPTIVASQGAPGDTMQFFFAWNTSAAEITNLTTTATSDDLLSVDGTFRTHHTFDLSDPHQLWTLFDNAYPTNINRNAAGQVTRLRKTVFYGDYSAQYTATYSRNVAGQVTEIGLLHGDFDDMINPGTEHRVARKQITRDSGDVNVISTPILAG